MTKRTNGEGSYRQRPDGVWECRFTLPSGKSMSLYGSTLANVKRKHKEARRMIDAGVDVEAGRESLAAFLDRWLTDVVQPSRAARTHASYSEIIRIHIVPTLGHVQMTKLTPEHVAALLAAKTKEGKKPATVQRIRSVLVSALGRAEKWGLVMRNVARLTDAPVVRRPEVKPMTPEQARLFLHAVRGDRLEALYRVAVSMGLRQGEALGLRWEDVELDTGTLRIRQVLTRLYGQLSFKEPKTEKSRRTLTMPASVVASLRSHRVRQLEERLAAGAE